MFGYTADLGHLDFDAELGAAPKKKKKKKKLGARIKKGLKKVGKAVAVVSTGGLAAVALKKKGAIKKALKKTKLGKTVKKGVSTLTTAAKKKVVKAVAKKKVVAKAKAAGASPAAANTLAKVVTARAADCGSKSDVAKLVAAQLTAQLAPKINQANDLLAKFDLQRMATSEHRKLMSESDFRREVLSLLALQAANGNQSCQKAVRVIMAGRN